MQTGNVNHNFQSFCSEKASFQERMISVSDRVALRIVQFRPSHKRNRPEVVFVAGWISQMESWKKVLKKMTADYPITYVETREKKSSRVKGKVEYSVESVGRDIAEVIKQLSFNHKEYILLGSSLGATAILDCCSRLASDPLCLILIAPNAVFRVPRLWQLYIRLFFPPFYFTIRPVIKWYLRTFRMQIQKDRSQYDKYCRALDNADPWKLKKAAMSLWKYQVWDKLPAIQFPALIVGASKDKLHEPENLKKMSEMLPHAVYLDLETNTNSHSEILVDEVTSFSKNLK